MAKVVGTVLLLYYYYYVYVYLRLDGTYLYSMHISHVSITALLSRVCIIHSRQTYGHARILFYNGAVDYNNDMHKKNL